MRVRGLTTDIRGCAKLVPAKAGIAVPGLSACATARRDPRFRGDKLCARGGPEAARLHSAPRRRVLPVEEDSTSIVNRLIE